MIEKIVDIDHDGILLEVEVKRPTKASGVVIFAHGSGSSRHSPRNKLVAQRLNDEGMATVLADLLSDEEDATRANRFDIELLTKRLLRITEYASKNMKNLPIGYFGASTGSAAALQAAAELKTAISAVVSRGGRPDMALNIAEVTAPTLIIVGGEDYGVIDLNQGAYDSLNCVKEYKLIPGATHLFEEAGALEMVANNATKWFKKYLPVKMDNL